MDEIMDKVLKSKIFLVLTPIITFVLFVVAGILLSYVPHVSGSTSGMTLVTGRTTTEYVFSIKNAVGIWLIGVAVSLLVLLVCILIRKITLKAFDNNN